MDKPFQNGQELEVSMLADLVMASRIHAKFLTYTGHWDNHIWKFIRVSKNCRNFFLSKGWAIDVVHKI